MKTSTIETLGEMKEENEKNNWFWVLPEESAKFIHDLILKHDCKNGLEVGSFRGYSTVWIASALKENKGKLVSIEIDKENALATESNCQKAGLDNVGIICGDALDVLKDLGMVFDFVFIDAKKDDYLTYLQFLLEKLDKKCVIVADNVISHKKKVADYLEFVKNLEGFTSKTIDIGKGLEITIREH